MQPHSGAETSTWHSSQQGKNQHSMFNQAHVNIHSCLSDAPRVQGPPVSEHSFSVSSLTAPKTKAGYTRVPNDAVEQREGRTPRGSAAGGGCHRVPKSRGSFYANRCSNTDRWVMKKLGVGDSRDTSPCKSWCAE